MQIVNISHASISNPGGMNTVIHPLSPVVFVEAETGVGACISAPQSTYGRLFVVSSDTNVNGRLIVTPCAGGDEILPGNVALLNKENLIRSVLHISATVGMFTNNTLSQQPCMCNVII